MSREPLYSGSHLAPTAYRQSRLRIFAEIVTIALFLAGVGVSLAGMHEAYLADQAYQMGADAQ